MAFAFEIFAPAANPVRFPVSQRPRKGVLFDCSRRWDQCLGLINVTVLTLLIVLGSTTAARAGAMMVDPKGFQNIPWGAQLADIPNLVLADPGERITGYDFRNGPPSLGDARVDSVRLSAIEGKFARAAIHYKGKKTHELIMGYLESQFGPVDRSPGAMVRGLNQQYNWRGPETEINLVYQALGERGVVFIESRVLAPRFNDTLSETGY
jgi:hypothetical protein